MNFDVPYPQVSGRLCSESRVFERYSTNIEMHPEQMTRTVLPCRDLTQPFAPWRRNLVVISRCFAWR